MHAGKLSMESIADFVHEVIKEEQLDNTILFGHSMGGYAAMAFLASHPEKLDGISLVHSSAKADSEEKKEIRQTANNFINLHGKELFLKNLIPKLYSSLQNYSHEKEQHLAMAMQYSNEQIIACYKAMMERPDRTHLLSQTNIPIQFIAGRADQSIALTDVLEQSKLVKLEILEGIGHSSMFENPKLLLAAIIGFADDILASFKS